MKNTYLRILVIFLCSVSMGYGQSTSEFFSKADAFFGAHVQDGKVAYKNIKADPDELEELIEMTKTISVSKDDAATYQAFWINGYNLLVIKGIIDHYPIKSPLDAPGFFDKTKYTIGGTSTTLNDIENKLLRANFPKEPRFHFVLVCAGLGCPPIINQAYMPSSLDAQLGEQTKKALDDSNFIRVNKNKVKVSQIFEWYKGDFTQEGKSLVDFINLYKTDKLLENSKVSYYPYDWTLNEL